MTAVEWLEDELKANLKKVILEGDSELMESLFEQAKAMEKGHIRNAFHNGYLNHSRNSEQYYNETFNNDEQQ